MCKCLCRLTLQAAVSTERKTTPLSSQKVTLQQQLLQRGRGRRGATQAMRLLRLGKEAGWTHKVVGRRSMDKGGMGERKAGVPRLI